MRFVLLLLLLVAPPQLAAAHSMLLASEPADGAVLGEGPDRIALRFNEPVVPVALRVIDAEGNTLHGPDGAIASDGGIAFDLPAKLPAGRYVVAYRVVSADTHPVAGSFVFAVGGAAELDAAPEEMSDTVLDAAWARIAAIVRFVRDLALAVGCGGLAFLAMFVPPPDRALRRALVCVAWLAVGATVLGVGVAGARVVQAPGLLDPAAWRIGASISAGPAAFAILAGTALVLRGRFPLPGLIAVAVGTALTGHAATGEPRWLVPAAQALHSLAALAWIGAFVPLLRGCASWPAPVLGRIGRSFSRTGVACVIALFAAGLTLAATRVSLPGELRTTDYGGLVFLKIALFAILLALAADNRLFALPGLAAGRGRFARNVALELAFAVGVLAVTASLSHTPPHSPDAHAGHAVAARGGPSIALVREGRVLTVEIVGDRLDLYFGDGPEPLEVEVELASPDRGIAGLRRTAQRVGAGQYRVQEPSLTIPGNWKIEIGVLITDFRKLVFATKLGVGPRKD